MIEIIVGVLALFAIPIAILVVDSATGPSPYEQLDAMWKDPTKRSRVRRMILSRRRTSKVPPPPRPPIATVRPAPDPERSEAELFAQLIDEPRDPGTRMVYADWLEEHGEAIKAAFVRGAALERAALLETTELAWRAATSNAAVPRHECETVRWSELRAVTGDVMVRECPYCTQVVRYCADDAEARVAIARDELAILDPGLAADSRPGIGSDVRAALAARATRI